MKFKPYITLRNSDDTKHQQKEWLKQIWHFLPQSALILPQNINPEVKSMDVLLYHYEFGDPSGWS